MNSIQQWLDRFELEKLNKIAPVIFFILMLWLCWRLANLFWWFVAPPKAPIVQTVMLGSQQQRMPNIVRFSLFEEQGQNPQAQQQADLPVKLEGVVLASPSYLSSAVLRINNNASSYRVGETLDDTNMTLAEIYWDRVFIREGSGQTREVKFGEETSTANLPPSDMSLNNASNRAVTSRSTRSVPSTRSNNSTSRNNDSPNRAINQAIEKLKQDREQYLGQMGVNNTQNGLEVTDQTPPALRARLGLKPGDKIVSVNGQNLSSGVNEAQLLEQVRQAGQAKIEIQRGDQTMTIQQSF